MSTTVLLANITHVLQSASTDPQAGIAVAKLTGDEHTTLFAAEIAAGRHVNAHYHAKGIEIYQIIEGEGVMYTGRVNAGGLVTKFEPFRVKTGDSFTIDEGMVYQLVNTGAHKLIALFICPASHLGADRVMTGDLL